SMGERLVVVTHDVERGMTEIGGKGDQGVGAFARGVTSELDGYIFERRLNPDNHRSPARCRAENRLRAAHPFVLGKQVELRPELPPDQTVAAGANAKVRLAGKIFRVHLVAHGEGCLKNRKDSSERPSFHLCADEGARQFTPSKKRQGEREPTCATQEL